MSHEALRKSVGFKAFKNNMVRHQHPTSNLDGMILGLFGSYVATTRIDYQNRCHSTSIRIGYGFKMHSMQDLVCLICHICLLD